jgi:hypothetical protein
MGDPQVQPAQPAQQMQLPEGALPSINEPPGSEVAPKPRRKSVKAKPRARAAKPTKAKRNGNGKPRKHK